MEHNGVFSFFLAPGTEVYCMMHNTAFPNLTLRTENITIDAKATLPEPTFSFVSENSGSLDFYVDATEAGKVYVDWGDGSISEKYIVNGSLNNFSTLEYVSNSTVKVYGQNISDISAYNIGLTALDVRNALKLSSLECYDNKLSVLDLSSNTTLTKLECYNNNLEALNMSNNTLLTVLTAYDNSLNTLDVTQNTELTHLDCENNNLSALNVANNTKLNKLYCSGNNLSAIDLSNNTELTGFNCSNNNLSSLDVNQNTQLNTLYCDGNQLSFATLPQQKASFSNSYYYTPQQNLATTCTNGVVDLSAQIATVDVDGYVNTTQYNWFLADGTPLQNNFMVENGVFSFVLEPGTVVYC